MQMHQAMSVIASGGTLLRPQVIQEIRDASGEVVCRFDRSEVRRVVSERTAKTMARLLAAVATKEGNGIAAAIPGYEVAGKTGTAQKIIDGQYSTKHHVASFVGFFPASESTGGNLRDHRRRRRARPGRHRVWRESGRAVVQAHRRATHSLSVGHCARARRSGVGAVVARLGRRPPMIGYLTQKSVLISAFGSLAVCRSRGDTVNSERVLKTAPKLSDYFEAEEILASKGPLDRPISGLAIDSRRVVREIFSSRFPAAGRWRLVCRRSRAPRRCRRRGPETARAAAGEGDVHPGGRRSRGARARFAALLPVSRSRPDGGRSDRNERQDDGHASHQAFP